MNTIPFYKNIGETPLEALERFRKDKPEYAHVPMTYAGRLDPLAEGLLILLAGDECMKKDDYTALPKEYEVEVLFGFATDTYDVLGMVSESSLGTVFPSARIFSCWKISLLGSPACERRPETLCLHSLSSTLEKFIGVYDQKYPPYSSRTVQGKPLWQWAREGKLANLDLGSKIEIPSHKVNVQSIEIKNVKEISGKKLHKKIKEMIGSVNGDFRQKEILESWENVFKDKGEESYQIATLTISCGSGTYVRVIANDIGEALSDPRSEFTNSPALAFHIKRTKIGDFKI